MLKPLIFLTLATYAISSPLVSNLNEDYRLPQDIVKVENYNIQLTVPEDIFSNYKFSGVATITILVKKITQTIQLHASLNITNVTLTSNTTGENIEQSYEINPTTKILTISSSNALAEGDTYLLKFYYTGDLSTVDMYGFYRSIYEKEDGTVSYLATTQFQPSHARRAFPCFDEPSFKATFEISIIHPNIYQALGNTKGNPMIQSPTLTLTTFEKTPRMSTYLIAFIIHDFNSTQSNKLIDGNIIHSVYSTRESTANRILSLDVTPDLVEALENYTGIKYNESGITKLDQVAIPDFAAGAMENWGLITYRETAILWDSLESSSSYKKRVVTVIAHELTHQWFGNLVTTHWWSETFLNEGFATFFEVFITADVQKDWKMEEQFLIDHFQVAMNADGVASAQSLASKASTPNEVEAKFGTISYSKGGTILRMIESILGANAFKEGLRSYLNEKKFDVATANELWAILETQFRDTTVGANLSTILDGWVNKAGFPVLNVIKEKDDVVVSQSRFLLSGNGSEDTTNWYVPISYTKSSDVIKFEETFPKIWLKPTDASVSISGVFTDSKWIILNNKVTGFYRVDYSAELWQAISLALQQQNFDSIGEVNRAQIVDDLFNFARIKKQTYKDTFSYVRFLKNETSFITWSSAFNGFNLMLQRTGDDKIRQELTNYIKELMNTFYESTPKNSEKHVEILAQILALSWACRVGNEECIKNALDEFSNYKVTKIKPNKDIRNIIYCNGLRYNKNPRTEWDFLWSEFGKTKLSTEQVTIISALGCVQDNAILKEYLLKSINKTSGIRSQDALSVFSSVYSGNPQGVDIALEFLIEHYKEITSHYNIFNALSSMFNSLSNRLSTQGQINKLTTFLQDANVPNDVKEYAKNSISVANINLEWTNYFENAMREEFSIPSSAIMPSKINFLSLIIIVIVLLNNNI